MKTLGSPIKMSATPPDVSRRAPQLGEHSDEILREAGFSEAEIKALRDAGALSHG
jgi:crotonobetainyl-CoA:carnitine CoA-transferase CaiB-like acyl-CoA transferase